MRGEFMLVDAVLEYAPANLLLDHDDALGGFGFSFEVSLEEYANVVAFGHAHKFADVCRTDHFSAKRMSERRSASLHVANELRLSARHPEILRLQLKCLLVL